MFKNILFCSGGKDSVATAILAKLKGEPIDACVFSEVMFDKKTSGEHPLHIKFVKERLKPFVEKELHIPFITLRAEKTFMDFFTHEITKGIGQGKTHGFPIPGLCGINRDCKLKPIREFTKSIGGNLEREYIGIADDEPIRLARLKGNKISLLQKYGYTECKAKELCVSYDLLSPVYEISKRNGCWFCPNCCDKEWVWLMHNAPEMVEQLILLGNTENLYRQCLTRTERPAELFSRLRLQANQLSIFD